MPSQREPVRIAFCITDLDPGGAERALVQLVTRLDRTRWQPAVYCLAGPGELVQDLESRQVPVTCLGSRSRFSLRVIGRLTREWRVFRPRLVQSFLFHANLMTRFAAARAGSPPVVAG